MGGVYGVGWSIVVGITWSGGNPTWENWILPYTHLPHSHRPNIRARGSDIFGLAGYSVLCFRGRQRTTSVGSGVRNQEKSLLIAMWCLLIISFGMQWLYTLAYGGFLGILEYSRSIRSAIFPIQNRLEPFFNLLVVSPCLLLSFGFFGCGYRDIDVQQFGRGFVCLCYSRYILYSWMGRIGFLTYLATFVLGAILYRRPRPFSLLFSGLEF